MSQNFLTRGLANLVGNTPTRQELVPHAYEAEVVEPHQASYGYRNNRDLPRERLVNSVMRRKGLTTLGLSFPSDQDELSGLLTFASAGLFTNPTRAQLSKLTGLLDFIDDCLCTALGEMDVDSLPIPTWVADLDSHLEKIDSGSPREILDVVKQSIWIAKLFCTLYGGSPELLNVSNDLTQLDASFRQVSEHLLGKPRNRGEKRIDSSNDNGRDRNDRDQNRGNQNPNHKQGN